MKKVDYTSYIWDARDGRHYVNIEVDGKLESVNQFDSAEDAAEFISVKHMDGDQYVMTLDGLIHREPILNPKKALVIINKHGNLVKQGQEIHDEIVRLENKKRKLLERLREIPD